MTDAPIAATHLGEPTEPDLPDRTTRAALIIVAMFLTGLTMRVGVTSIGPVLDDLQAGLHIGGGLAGLLTSLPVIVFAVVGVAAPRLARRSGEHRLLVISLIAMTVGLATRAIVGNYWVFLALSTVGLIGGAVSNILLPSLVKRHFPDRIGGMTAMYSTALAIGATAGAGLT
ncbi:MAG: MFS transporter, partial [Actinobacteria bacterium]|nr:MFS transporter [Actinomycetota bacterium]